MLPPRSINIWSDLTVIRFNDTTQKEKNRLQTSLFEAKRGQAKSMKVF